MITFDFSSKKTPDGIPVTTTFFVRDKLYVVDRLGAVYYVNVGSDDVDEWYWTVVCYL
jgi:hypothetical protein